MPGYNIFTFIYFLPCWCHTNIFTFTFLLLKSRLAAGEYFAYDEIFLYFAFHGDMPRKDFARERCISKCASAIISLMIYFFDTPAFSRRRRAIGSWGFLFSIHLVEQYYAMRVGEMHFTVLPRACLYFPSFTTIGAIPFRYFEAATLWRDILVFFRSFLLYISNTIHFRDINLRRYFL